MQWFNHSGHKILSTANDVYKCYISVYKNIYKYAFKIKSKANDL